MDGALPTCLLLCVTPCAPPEGKRRVRERASVCKERRGREDGGESGNPVSEGGVGCDWGYYSNSVRPVCVCVVTIDCVQGPPMCDITVCVVCMGLCV